MARHLLLSLQCRASVDASSTSSVAPAIPTVANRPWLPVVVLEFPTERAANRFERYLKSGSGRAFAKRHFGD